jgi:hypothetical protein
MKQMCLKLHQQRKARTLSGGKTLWRAGVLLAIALLLLVGSAGVAGADMPTSSNSWGDSLLTDLEPVDQADLERSRGGERTVVNLSDMSGIVEGNEINAVNSTMNTGSTSVSGDSFQDFNGVSSIILNSGNNVSIQSSTTVNILIE